MKKLFLSLFVVYFSFASFSKNFEDALTKDASANSVNRINNASLTVKIPKYIFSGLNTNIDLAFNNAADEKLVSNNNDLFFIINGEDTKVHFDKSGVGTFNHTFDKDENLTIYAEDFNYSSKLHIIPIWYVVVPVGLLVLFLSYKLFRSGKKNKAGIQSIPGKEAAESTEAKEETRPKVKFKEVVEKEEEVFA